VVRAHLRTKLREPCSHAVMPPCSHATSFDWVVQTSLPHARTCMRRMHARTHQDTLAHTHGRMDAQGHDELNKAVGAARCTLGDCRLSGTFARLRCACGAWGAPTLLPRDTRRARTRN
jgi:hypothetical protein